MNDPEELLPGKCIVCFTRGSLQHYAGHFSWLNASICTACDARQAEPLILVVLSTAARGGPEACEPGASAWVSYLAPHYIGWPEICALYRDNIDYMLDIVATDLGPETARLFRNPAKIIKQ